MQLGDYLKKHNLSQTDFARLVGESVPNINRYVAGVRRPLNRDAMRRIFDATGGLVSANDFYGLPDPPKRRNGKRTNGGP